jgi:hypothetical protein
MWEKGQSGNPEGRRLEKPFLDNLKRAIVQDDAKRLRAAAEKLLDMAAEGVPWAMELLIEKLDGKSPVNVKQEVDVTHRVVSVPETDSFIAEVIGGRADRALPESLPN